MKDLRDKKLIKKPDNLPKQTSWTKKKTLNFLRIYCHESEGFLLFEYMIFREKNLWIQEYRVIPGVIFI